MPNALIVTCHPRGDSLTAAAAARFMSHADGVDFEVADLYAEGFDPRLGPEDEPDWDNPGKTYSDAVRSEMARVEYNQATVMVFPVWWWSVPAMLKGWIDRVWNHGWAYGFSGPPAAYPHADVWMLGICGNNAESFAKRGYDKAIETQLKVGVLDYCGVERPRLELLYGSLEGEDAVAKILEDAGRLGGEFSQVMAES